MKQTLNQWTGGSLLAGFSLIGITAVAQDVGSLDQGMAAPAPQQQHPMEESGRLPVIVSAGVTEQFNGSIDSGGDFSLTRVKLSAGVPVKLNDNMQIGTTGRYEYDHYNFNNVTAPWENINTLSASSILNWRVDDRWTAYGGGFLKMSAESGTALNRGTSGGGLGGASYLVSDDLSLGLGLAVASQLKENTRVLPLITAKWHFADNWRLNVGLTDVDTLGYGAEVKYLFDEQWDFGFGVQFHKSRFRIDAGDGVGQEEATTLYAQANWHASANVELNGFFGIATGGKLRQDNSSGDKLAQSDYDPAAILGLSATLKF